MLIYLINFLGNCLELYISNLFYSKVSERRVTNKQFWILNALLVILQFLNNNLFLTKSYLVIIASFFFFFLISFLYKLKLPTRLFIGFLLFILFGFSEVCIAMIVTSFLHIDLAYTQENLILFAICTLSSKYLAFAIISMLKFGDKKNNRNTISVSFTFKTMLLPIASFIILILLFECCYKITDFSFQITTLAASVSLIFANIFIFYTIDKQTDYIKTKQQLYFAQNHIKNQISHYDELYRYQNDIRMFKHDMKNRMLALLGLLNNENTEKAISEIKIALSMVDDNNIINTGNPVIDAVIRSKIIIAKSKNIDIELSSKLTKNIEIDSLELGVLLGNALDNAIEATEKINNNRSPIYISLITVEDLLSIEINNPVESNINTKQLLSKKSDKQNHGYGIKSIQAIAQKYNGNVSFSCESSTFFINISLVNTGILT